uniref:Mitochondrial inner membrane protease subunit 2 n=1 Tax=Anser brachyrhynchus TaxID=132585 RepID=A0A8B9BL71_9AVES
KNFWPDSSLIFFCHLHLVHIYKLVPCGCNVLLFTIFCLHSVPGYHRSLFPLPWELESVIKLSHPSRSPRNPEQKIIKRVIALEGDIIKTIGYKKKYVKVPHGHIWVEGDHHGHSFDSNAFGPVSLGLLHARATHILWPPKRWQKLQPILPPERKPLQREQE